VATPGSRDRATAADLPPTLRPSSWKNRLHGAAELDRQRTGRIVAKLAALGVPPRSPDDVAAHVQPDRGLWIAVGLLLTAALNEGAALVGRRADSLVDPRRSGDQGGAAA
jgi:hypothetical protein